MDIFDSTNKTISLNSIKFQISHANSVDGNPSNQNTHLHNCYEIYLNVSGDVSFLVNNRIYPIKSGDIIITRPNELHHCIYHRVGVHEHFCLWFYPDEGLELLKFLDASTINYLSLNIEEKQKILTYFYELSQDVTVGTPLKATTDFLQILSLIEAESAQSKSATKKPVSNELQKILDYINANFREITHINELFGVFFISSATLNRWFTKYLHISPKAYLESVKLSNAKRILDSGYSVNEACFDSGFTDCSHFISIFRRNFGQTPLQYKNEQIKNSAKAVQQKTTL